LSLREDPCGRRTMPHTTWDGSCTLSAMKDGIRFHEAPDFSLSDYPPFAEYPASADLYGEDGHGCRGICAPAFVRRKDGRRYQAFTVRDGEREIRQFHRQERAERNLYVAVGGVWVVGGSSEKGFAGRGMNHSDSM